jgi:hypothetical protein
LSGFPKNTTFFEFFAEHTPWHLNEKEHEKKYLGNFSTVSEQDHLTKAQS